MEKKSVIKLIHPKKGHLFFFSLTTFLASKIKKEEDEKKEIQYFDKLFH